MRLTWSRPADLLPHAFVQAGDENVPVDDLIELWVASGGVAEAYREGAGPVAPAALQSKAGDLLDEIDRRTPGACGAGESPTSSHPGAAIAQAEATVLRGQVPADRTDRLRGAWLGRAAGCVLGKPVEKIPREGIRAVAEATGNWPIHEYFTERGLPPAVGDRWPWNRRSRRTSLQETIDGIPEDDDLNFPMLGLGLLEDHGAAFTTDDVAETWLQNLPAGRVFTAERAAYRNLLDAVPPVHAAMVRNPFREWIGALIRTDVYGWAHPGDPVTAARLAEVDALLSHRRDGVHGARFAAAAAAVAVVASDVATVLDAGLAVVPNDSRFAGAVRFGRELAASGQDVDTALDALHHAYGRLHWVHVLNNAALIGYALAAGDGDYSRSISLAVAGGWDTDSDAATVGGICGALIGAEALPPQWTGPIGERFRTSLPGFDGVTVDELVARVQAVGR